MTRSMILAAVLVAACSGSRGLPDPTVTDEGFTEGRVLELPVEGEFPRLGIQWNYDVDHGGFPKEEYVPARTAYRLTKRDAMGHPWSGWWIYGTPPEGVTLRAEQTGATIEEDDVFFHPPREYAFVATEWAPWPIARPGEPGKRATQLTLGEGWGENEGQVIEKVYEEKGGQRFEVGGRVYDDCWLVEGSSKGWKGRFWWVARVGWIRMEFVADDGRKQELSLREVRLISAPGEAGS